MLVLRVMDGSSNPHPKPNGPFPSPESYATAKCGPNPERPPLAGIGILADAVPEAALTEKLSPMPLIAPPPLGRLIDGRLPDDFVVLAEVEVDFEVDAWFNAVVCAFVADGFGTQSAIATVATKALI